MMDDVALVEIEAIKQLKARYCRYLDAKNWDAWRDLLADNFISEIAGAGGRHIVGADDFVTYTRRTIGKPSQPTVHQVHAPEITLTSATTARGVWALKRRRVPGPGGDPAWLRPLPRNLREERRTLAHQVLEADPASRGRCEPSRAPGHR